MAHALNGKRAARKRSRVRERDGDGCFYCGEPMLFERPAKCPQWQFASHPLRATLEHLVNQRDGGGQALDNLALAHRSCNTRRSQMSLDEKLASRSTAPFRVSV